MTLKHSTQVRGEQKKKKNMCQIPGRFDTLENSFVDTRDSLRPGGDLIGLERGLKDLPIQEL